MKKFYLLASLILFSSCYLFAQNREPALETIIAKDGTPEFIKFKNGEPLAKTKELFKEHLNVTEENELRFSYSTNDELNHQHQKYQQFYEGIKVEYAEYNVHAKNGLIQVMNGEFLKITNVKTQPSLSESAALQVALDFVGANSYIWENSEQEEWLKHTSENENASFYPIGELVIVKNYLATDRENYMQPRLAYKFNIYAEKPLSRDYIYVDAITGQVIHKNAIIKHAAAAGNADTRYSGARSIGTDSYSGAYRLRDYTRGNGLETYDMNNGTNYSNAVDFSDNDNNWTSAEWDNTDKNNAALDAHWGAMMTYDYFKSKHNRNSFDNAGAKIKSYVHYSNDYENAFWNGSVMTYGDGATRFDALTSLDVAAHEIGHAVCDYTADLVYSYESGAMNEGFSDIWGAAVEYYAAPEKQTWLIGEDIDLQQAALRSMSDPNSQSQPDTYKGDYWYTGSGDNGGVHTNSGVLNHWFYILTVGKTGTNDIGNSYSVTGIGIDKAAAIAYRTESVYLTSNSEYIDARTYSIQSAIDLYGDGSDEVVQTTNAWHAVGIGGEYGDITYCASQGNNSSYEWIAGVSVGEFSNSSSAAGYTDFTALTISLTAGNSYSISLTPGFSGSSYNEYWRIWIDYNGNGSFDDSGELVFDPGSLSKTTVSGTINIPSTASGTKRMRVSMKYNAAPTSCESFSYGEVEDYTVSFGETTSDTEAPTAPSNLSTSNLTETSVDLSWTASTDNVGVTGYNVYLNDVLKGTVTSTAVSFTGLSSGTTYKLGVEALDEAGNISARSSISVTTLTADTEAPTAPTDLSASNITENSADISWTASSDNVGVTGYNIYVDGSLAGTTANTSASITGLSASTTYTIAVEAEDEAGNKSAKTSIDVTTAASTVTYCASSGSNTDYEYIDLVELNELSNPTGANGGYADFTNLTASVSPGSSQKIYISAGFTGTKYTEYWRIWIDFNNDGDFTDSGELIVSGSSSSSAKLSASFTVPSTAKLGNTRMRVSMKYGSGATSCESFTYGEVEDYTVNITTTTFSGFTAGSNAENLGDQVMTDVSIYPNPTTGLLNIRIPTETAGKADKLIVTDLNGSVIEEININRNSHTLDVSNLAKGVYLLNIHGERGVLVKKFIVQ